MAHVSNRQRTALREIEVTVTGVKSRVSTWELQLLGARVDYVDRYRRIRGLIRPVVKLEQGVGMYVGEGAGVCGVGVSWHSSAFLIHPLCLHYGRYSANTLGL